MAAAPVELRRQEFELPDLVTNHALAGAAKTITVPAGMRWALIRSTDTVWLNRTGAATVPAADELTGVGSFPFRVGDDRPFYIPSTLLAFSVIGTATVAIAWFRDHGGS